MDDPFALRRFVDAQRDSYEHALDELRCGRKKSHWMWFVFPQIAGLGSSATARLYALSSLEEARAYLADPLLGARLRACTAAVNAHGQCPAREIFGSPDDLKFRSSMTLFAEAAPDDPGFARALQLFFRGEPDRLTLDKVRSRA